MADLTPTPGAQVANGTYTLTNPLVGANGTAATAPRSDMRPTVPSPATPTTQAFGDAASSGAGTGFATDTHRHGMPAAPTGGLTLAGSSTTPTSTSSTTAVTLVSITGLSIAVGSWIEVWHDWRKQALGAQAVAFGLAMNSTTVLEAAATSGVPRSTATNEAQSGYVRYMIPPRQDAAYGYGVQWDWVGWNASGTYRTSLASDSGVPANMTAVQPQAVVTTIAIRTINNTSSNAVEVTNIAVWTR